MKPTSPGLAALCRTYNTKSPEEAMRSAMRELLGTCGENPPIGLRGICRQLDVRFGWNATAHRIGAGTASLHASSNGEFEIVLHDANFRRRWRRARFSVAHELAHALLLRLIQDPALIASLDDTAEDLQELERTCNAGAAELLMPSTSLRQAILQFGLGPEGLIQLYDHFLVSWAALLWQIAWVLPNGSCVRWRKYARHDREAVAFRVVACYPSYRSRGRRPWLPNGATTSHLNSRVVESTVAENRPVKTEGAEIKLGSRKWRGDSLGTFVQKRTNLVQPVLNGFPVPDEMEYKSAGDVLLFHSSSSRLLSSKSSTILLAPLELEENAMERSDAVERAHV